MKGDCESSSTSQFCASCCIHVPMLEVHAPNHNNRKSRYRKALKPRLNKESSLRQRLFAFDQMEDVAIAIFEEYEMVALVVEGLTKKLDTSLFESLMRGIE